MGKRWIIEEMSDERVGCGGWIARLVALGLLIWVLSLLGKS
jgi:cobalamin synthase